MSTTRTEPRRSEPDEPGALAWADGDEIQRDDDRGWAGDVNERDDNGDDDAETD